MSLTTRSSAIVVVLMTMTHSLSACLFTSTLVTLYYLQWFPHTESHPAPRRILYAVSHIRNRQNGSKCSINPRAQQGFKS